MAMSTKPIIPDDAVDVTPDNTNSSSNKIDLEAEFGARDNYAGILVFGTGSYLNIETWQGTTVEIGPLPQYAEINIGISKIWQSSQSTHPSQVLLLKRTLI